MIDVTGHLKNIYAHYLNDTLRMWYASQTVEEKANTNGKCAFGIILIIVIYGNCISVSTKWIVKHH